MGDPIISLNAGGSVDKDSSRDTVAATRRTSGRGDNGLGAMR
jgi:hypothetical protein